MSGIYRINWTATCSGSCEISADSEEEALALFDPANPGKIEDVSEANVDDVEELERDEEDDDE